MPEISKIILSPQWF